MKIISLKTVVYAIAIICMLHFNIFAQNDLYMPRNIKSAYVLGTRSYDGKPGKNYWQNYSDYKINVKVTPTTRLVEAEETIIYHNNSPKEIDRIVFRLYQNINRIGSARSRGINKEIITDGDIISDMTIGGVKIDLNNKKKVQDRGTNFIVILDSSISSKSSVEMKIKWSFIIPNTDSDRMGTYDSTSFLIGYWYPQVAVYDDIDGWDIIPFNGTQEFYNDFSNYDVSITVPNKFGVWGTGVLQNSNDLLKEKYLSRYNDAHKSNDVLTIVNAEDINTGDIYYNNSEFNTWHFKAESVPDFVFGTSDHYLWDAVGLTVDATTDRRVFISAVYKKESEDFKDVAEIAKQSIKYFSTKMPAVPFPFPSLTVFNGQGGMEYPMLINDGSASTWERTVGVTSHEIAHQYMPFYMGINEKKYAFMDEGWAQMLPFDFQTEYGKYNARRNNTKFYSFIAGNEIDMPLMIPANLLNGFSYSVSAYSRPGQAYDYLRNLLGDELFLKGLHNYMNNWNHKHPGPYDFFYSFNNGTGKNLNWYWEPWFFEKGYPDLGIKNVEKVGDTYKVLVEKVGNMPVPIKLTFKDDKDNDTTITKPVAIWENSNEFLVEVKIADKISSIILGGDTISDVNNENNLYKFE